MKIKLLVAALFAVAGTSVMAQSAFNGAFGQVGIGYSSASPSGTNGSQTISTAPMIGTYSRSTSFSSTADFTGTVTVGYYGTISNNFLLGVGAEYSPLAGSNTNATTTGGGLTSVTSQYKVQNSYNIFLSPAIAIDKDKLLYGKVGYAGTSIATTNAGNNPTLNFTGYSLGVGYKQIISGGLYGFAEGNYYSYGNKPLNTSGTFEGLAYTTTQTVNANAFNLLAGIGYKF